MKPYLLPLLTGLLFLQILFLGYKVLDQEKEIKVLQIRLDEQELLNKIGKELITSKLNIR
jgi:hypothetical protein